MNSYLQNALAYCELLQKWNYDGAESDAVDATINMIIKHIKLADEELAPKMSCWQCGKQEERNVLAAFFKEENNKATFYCGCHGWD